VGFLHPEVWAEQVSFSDDVSLLEDLVSLGAAQSLLKYNGAWRSFVRFCLEKKLSPLPASSGTVVRYFHFLRLSRKGKTVLQTASECITFVHSKCNNFDSPAKAFMPQRLRLAVNQARGGPVSRKKPLSKAKVKALVQRNVESDLDWRFHLGVMFSLMFSFLCRWSDMARSVIEKSKLSKTRLFLGFRKRKNEPFFSEVSAGLIGGPFCPGRLRRKWSRRFPRFSKGSFLRDVDFKAKPVPVVLDSIMPYNKFLRVMRKELVAIGVDPDKVFVYATHSFRRGGAKELRRAGTADSELLRAGNWHQLESVPVYATPSRQSLRRTTGALWR
tara:strand:- start:70 stop:1056 length:987 start_codon:yes stop_codon:yes gene_type:complete